MTDFKKLVSVASGEPKKVTDSRVLSDEKKKAIKDALERRKNARKYASFKVTDSYKNALKKIKDELEATENTDEAVECAISALQEVPAEQVVAAVVEVLSEAIDVLQKAEPAEGDPEPPADPAEGGSDEGEGASEGSEVKDSVQVTVDNGTEQVTVDAEGGDSVVDAPVPPVAEEPLPPVDEAPVPPVDEGAEPPIDEAPLGDSAKAPSDEELDKLVESLNADGANITKEQLKKAYAAFRAEQVN